MKVKIILEMLAPTNCTKDEFDEWLRFELGTHPKMKKRNPLVDYRLDLKQDIKNGDIDLSYTIQ